MQFYFYILFLSYISCHVLLLRTHTLFGVKRVCLSLLVLITSIPIYYDECKRKPEYIGSTYNIQITAWCYYSCVDMHTFYIYA